jgi:thiol-disulfide isomerase/thioredoxin
MTKKTITIIAIALILLTGVVAFSINSQKTRTEQSKNNNESASTINNSKNIAANNNQNTSNATTTDMTKKGSFVTYSADMLKKADDGNVVLFFNATWCPTCKSTVSDLNSKMDKIPSNLTILSVDYDSQSTLRQKYGVTMQHTFVKVDSSGNQIKKTNGLDTLEKIIEFTN